jgi:RNA polymerase sigma factor (sigma-70 family)
VRRYNSIIRASVLKTFRSRAGKETDRKAQFPDDMIDDLVQAVYMRLVEDENRALAHFQGAYENSIFQYLSIISINVVLDYFRESKAKKRPMVSNSLDEMIETSGDGAVFGEKVAPINGIATSSEENLIAKAEIERALKRAVTGKHRDRDITIFKLRYYDGLTLGEIKKALNLDITSVSVGSILNRITLKLRQTLRHYKDKS